ncbi:hypothetical protein CMUS01_10585 [Colletotrichum musicola]|uniref:Uncharacterized protein n=1 Tax=Colletotrichum musicola TaxID=2175873 RepID=A0A8H6K2R4_9PEZI|nr:hypothetical protein CMUS01_10585 [Colletotrichum musicola]
MARPLRAVSSPAIYPTGVRLTGIPAPGGTPRALKTGVKSVVLEGMNDYSRVSGEFESAGAAPVLELGGPDGDRGRSETMIGCVGLVAYGMRLTFSLAGGDGVDMGPKNATITSGGSSGAEELVLVPMLTNLKSHRYLV